MSKHSIPLFYGMLAIPNLRERLQEANEHQVRRVAEIAPMLKLAQIRLKMLPRHQHKRPREAALQVRPRRLRSCWFYTNVGYNVNHTEKQSTPPKTTAAIVDAVS